MPWQQRYQRRIEGKLRQGVQKDLVPRLLSKLVAQPGIEEPRSPGSQSPSPTTSTPITH